MSLSHDITTNKRIIGYVAIFMFIGAGLLTFDYRANVIDFDGSVTRNEAGEGDYFESFTVETIFGDVDVDVTLKELQRDEQEQSQLFEQAIAEIDSSYLGSNETPNQVYKNLKLKDNYADGHIEARWTFDDYEIINSDGQINVDAIPDEGKVINAAVYLTLGEATQIYDFSFRVEKAPINTDEGIQQSISREIEKIVDQNPDMKEIDLPKSIDGTRLMWKRKMDYRGLWLMILSAVTGIGVIYGKKQDEKKAIKELNLRKLKDYPLIVNELLVLMGAGMSFRVAVLRISQQYQTKIARNPMEIREGFEEIVVLKGELEQGVGELKAIDNFARRNDIKEYKKLALLLSQNIRKGSRDLLDELERENALASEMRKQMALRAGEEASTKLLLPMGGMLVVVVMILIYPAIAVLG